MRSTVRHARRAVALLLLIALALPTQSALAQSDVTQTLATRDMISYAPGDGPVLLDPELTITGNASDVLGAAVVSIGEGFVRIRDTLGISGQEGADGTVDDLMWSYDNTTGLMTVTGEATVADYQAALRQVTFSNSSTNPLATERSIVISLGAVFYRTENGHFYEFVSAPRISWTDAKSAAEARTHAGLSGYLVTITSEEENEFVTDRLIGGGWMGASDQGTDKQWHWRSGPEAGTHFFTQASGEDGCGEGPAETQPSGDHYSSWDMFNGREPNDFDDGCAGSEDHAYIVDNGLWNDWTDDAFAQAFGYTVEYGGLEGESIANDGPVSTILVQADVPSFTIEQAWDGDDPQVATSFTVVPEVDDCTAEQTVSIPAGEPSIEVLVAAEAGETACTYTVTETAPVGYTVSPEEVTAVAPDGTATFRNTEISLGALPETGTTTNVLGILGLTLAGPGWLILAGARRNERRSTRRCRRSAAGRAQRVDRVPVDVDDHRPTATAPAPATTTASASPTASAFTAAVLDVSAPPELELEKKPPAVIQATGSDVNEAASEPHLVGGGILQDLLQLIDDLAED